MTLAQSLTRFSPLSASRPASRPAAVAPPPVEQMDVHESGGGGWRTAGLALVGAGLALGALSGGAQAQEVRLETPQSAVDRNAAPISQENWERMKAAGTVNPRDNASVREIKEAYTRAAEDLLPEADLFQQQGKTLETTARWLEQLAEQQGPGTHQIGTGTLTVKDGKITLVTESATKSVTRTGDTTVVEVTEDGFTTRLEDTNTYRSITEAGTTRTLYLRDSLLRKAGEFQVQNWSENTVVAGTTISRQTAENNETWELKPNLTYRSNAGQTEVKPDGSAVHAGGRVEAAQPNAPVTFTVFQ